MVKFELKEPNKRPEVFPAGTAMRNPDTAGWVWILLEDLCRAATLEASAMVCALYIGHDGVAVIRQVHALNLVPATGSISFDIVDGVIK